MNTSGSPPEAELSRLRSLLNARRLAELESEANTLLQQYPGTGLVWEMLGIAQQMQGKNALHAFQKTAELMPDDAGAQYNLAVLLKHVGRLNEALTCCHLAVSINPGYAEAYTVMGSILNELGKPDEAEKFYRRALEIKPGHAEAHFNLSKTFFQKNEFDAALRSYRDSVPGADPKKISVCSVETVKAFCKRTGSAYHLLSPPQAISFTKPEYIGEKFGVIEGTTQSSEFFVAELAKAKVLAKHSVVIMQGDIALYDDLVHPLGENVDLRFEKAIRIYSNRKLLIDQSAYNPVYAERGVNLTGASTGVYGHWMFEHLPKIKLVDALPQYKSFPVYVDVGMPPSHYEALELLTKGERKLVPVRPNTSVEFEKLVVAPSFTFFPFAQKPGSPVNMHVAPASTEASLFLRERLLSVLGLTSDPFRKGEKGRRIFIGRKSKARSLINQDEIQEFLLKYDFEVIYPEEYSFAQQVKIFNESEYVFGPNGSAFTNVIFCRQGAKIVSFVQSYGSNFSSWPHVLKQLGYDHLYVAGNAIPSSAWHEHQLDYSVPMPLVRQALDHFRVSKSN